MGVSSLSWRSNPLYVRPPQLLAYQGEFPRIKNNYQLKDAMPEHKTMRAWVFTERGDPSQVLTCTTLDKPSLPLRTPLPRDAPAPEEWVVVKTAFVGLNVGAIFQMTLIPQMVRTKTCVPEMDLSGVVEDVWHPEREADSSSAAAPFRFRKGDKVVAMLPASHSLATGTGALAEYVAISRPSTWRASRTMSAGGTRQGVCWRA